MLIINADDLGKDPSINTAVVRAFETGLCSSATIMATTCGFEEACQLAHERKLLDRIGVHLVLDGYSPLTEEIRKHPRLCDENGRLCLGSLSASGRLLLALGSEEKAALAREVRAQVRRCRDRGLPITHIDSHHHIHTAWAVASIVIRIAKEEGIPFIRIARNLGQDSSVFKAAYKHIFNAKLKMLRLAATDHFGSIDDILGMRRRGSIQNIVRSCEIMVHPRLNERDLLVEDSNGLELEPLVRQIDGYIDACGYGRA